MSKGRTATLNELMGSAGGASEGKKLSIDDLSSLLGERMPKLEFTPVGRIRMINALKGRFGNGFRNLPGIADIIKDFDNMAEFEVTKHKMRMLGKGNSNAKR